MTVSPANLTVITYLYMVDSADYIFAARLLADFSLAIELAFIEPWL
jgi:hypothetical protein